MMAQMIGAASAVHSVCVPIMALTNRPATPFLVASVVAVGIALFALWNASTTTRPATPVAQGSKRPDGLDVDGKQMLEPPAVVALLTNGYVVPPSACAATLLDLAARRWARFGHNDGELVVVTNSPAGASDALRGFEQQVLNHVVARSLGGACSAGTLAASQYRLGRRWWRRFDADVVKVSQELGLTEPRYSSQALVPPAIASAVGLLLALGSWRRGDATVDLADSYLSRFVLLVTMIGSGFVLWQTLDRWRGSAQVPTELGERRAAAWIGYRSRLRSRIPERATVLAAPAQQLALAHGLVMGVAEHVNNQIPVAPEDDRNAWSEAGGTPHVVKVWYPLRPGYGIHPLLVLGVGAITMIVSFLLRRFLQRVADGDALTSLIGNVADQAGLIEGFASVLAWLMIVPLLISLWAIVAGIIDSVATRERTGVIVRTRHPAAVVPLPRLLQPLAERDRYAVFLAIDDGRRKRISSWIANERTAAPQGAQARVRATPLLGYVRSSEPIGTGARIDHE